MTDPNSFSPTEVGVFGGFALLVIDRAFALIRSLRTNHKTNGASGEKPTDFWIRMITEITATTITKAQDPLIQSIERARTDTEKLIESNAEITRSMVQLLTMMRAQETQNAADRAARER